MDAGAIVTLITQGGSTAVLLLVLQRLWDEHKKQAAWMRKKVDDMDLKITVLSRKAGLDTQDLHREAEILRKKFGKKAV